MQTEKDPRPERKRRTKRRTLKLVLALSGILILSVVFLLPALVSSAGGRRLVLAKINSSIDGKTDFAGFSMSWWRGISVSDFSFNDSVGQTIVEAKQIATRPHYGSILMGELSFGKTVIDEPRVVIDLTARRPQKTEGPGEVTAVDKKREAIVLPITKIDLQVNDGNLKVTDARAKMVELSQINSTVSLRPPGQRTNFEISMALADAGKESKIRAGGRIVPERKTGWTLKGTSGDLAIEVEDLDIGSLGPLLALAGFDIEGSGIVSANIKSEIRDGRMGDLSGTLKGRDLDITGPALKGDRLQTSTLEVSVKATAEQELISIEKLDVHSDWADIKASGTVPTTFQSLAEFVEADSAHSLEASFDCDLAALLSRMPHTFGLKEGMRVTSGRLVGNITTSSEADRREIRGSGSLAGLAGVIDGKRIALSEPVQAEVGITSDKEGIRYDRLNVSAPFGQIDCTGTSKLLKYDANVDLAKLQAQLGQFIDIGEYQMSGGVLSRGQVTSSKGKIGIAGSSVVRNLNLRSEAGTSASEPKADIAFAANIQRDKNIIELDSVKADTSFGQVNIKKAVLPLNEKAKEPMNLPISGVNLNLERLQPFVALFATLPKDMHLAGVADSKINISSKKGLYRIASGATRIKNLKLNWPQREPFEQSKVSIVFDVEIDPDANAVNVRNFKLESPQIKIHKSEFKKNSKGTKTKLQGRIDFEYDWAAVSAVAAPYLPQGLKLEGKTKNKLDFSCEYPTGQTDKLLANLDISKSKLGFTRAEYMGLTFGPTETDVQIQNGLLKMSPFSTKVNNGKFRFAGNIDFKQQPALLKTAGPMQILEKVQINDEVSKHLLVYLNPIFVNQANVSGISNFHCEKLSIPLGAGNKDELEVIGTVAIDKMRLKAAGLLGSIMSRTNVGRGVDAALLPTRFELKKDVLAYNNMQINIDKYPVNFGGAIGPDIVARRTGRPDKKLDMTVTTPYAIDLERGRIRTVKVGEEATAERISLVLKGTLHNPDFRLDKMFEDVLKKALEQLLRDRIFDKLLKDL